MPTLVPHITVDFNELFEDGAVTSGTFGCKSGGVVEMAVYVGFVFIIRVRWAKNDVAE